MKRILSCGLGALLLTLMTGWLSSCGSPVSYAEPQALVFEEARFHLGDAPEGWMTPDFDDSAWETMAIPQKWQGEGMYAQYRIRFTLPEGFVATAPYPQIAVFDLSYIDDCDESYLNGTRIGKSGTMPHDGGIPQSAWDARRLYHVDASLLQEGDNLLTLLVWNRRTRGGIYDGPIRIGMARLEDLLTLSCTDDGDGGHCRLNVSCELPVKGVFRIETKGKVREKRVKLDTSEVFSQEIHYDGGEPVQVKVSFRDSRTGMCVERDFTPKYCLTPPAPKEPRYNGPAVLGARPGSPIIFRLPFSGLRPMTFQADGLPDGLTLDTENGVLRGSVAKAGDYPIRWTAENTAGSGSGALTLKVGSKLALTPPMGWNSWNCWGLDISQGKVFSSADALINSGLADYGYCYVNIDDAWQGAARSEDGVLEPNEQFPDIAGLGEWLHERGLRLGIYSSPGELTCGGYLGSLGFEQKDADTWNAWGVDYLKYDLCGYRTILDKLPKAGRKDHIFPYRKMEKGLRKQPRDICYSLCQYGLEKVWQWGADVDANLWRTTGDITDTWASVLRIGFNLQRGLAAYAGPGHWNDPDMLVIGKVGWGEGLRESRLSADEQYSHLSLWALLAAPMIIGCDLAQPDRFTLNLLCNHEVIAIDQDPLGQAADCVWEQDGLQVWTRPLADGSFAAGLFNLSEAARTVDVRQCLAEAGAGTVASCRDLWRQAEAPASFTILTHGVLFVKYRKNEK